MSTKGAAGDCAETSSQKVGCIPIPCQVKAESLINQKRRASPYGSKFADNAKLSPERAESGVCAENDYAPSALRLLTALATSGVARR